MQLSISLYICLIIHIPKTIINIVKNDTLIRMYHMHVLFPPLSNPFEIKLTPKNLVRKQS